jgi:hypothetical protein
MTVSTVPEMLEGKISRELVFDMGRAVSTD